MSDTRRLPYGWVIAIALSITETVTWGIVYYGFPVFLRAMERDLGASRVAITGAFSIGLAVSAAAALPIGRWIDRHGARGLMTGGSCLASLLLLAWARVGNVSELYAVWALMGVAMAATLYEPAFAVVVSWFRRDASRPLLVVTLVAGFASTIFMPIEAWLLECIGWRAALDVLAMVLAGVTIPLHALVLRPGPAAETPPTAGPAAAPGPADAPPAIVPAATLGAAARTPVFWALAVGFFASNFAVAAVSLHLIPYLTSHGYSAPAAAATIGWIGAMQVAGRLVFVPIGTRLGARWMVAAVFLGQAAGLALLPTIPALGTALPFIVVLGASNGMATLTRATSLAKIFGPRHYGAIGGAIALASNAARAIGPVGTSLLLVGLGGYPPVFATLAAGLALVALAVLAAGRRIAS